MSGWKASEPMTMTRRGAVFNIDWSRYRLVDVTLRVVPGEVGRRLALRRYTFPVDGSFGCEVDTVTHLGTHVEAPAHYYPQG